jgi:hypothetical protein
MSDLSAVARTTKAEASSAALVLHIWRNTRRTSALLAETSRIGTYMRIACSGNDRYNRTAGNVVGMRNGASPLRPILTCGE